MTPPRRPPHQRPFATASGARLSRPRRGRTPGSPRRNPTRFCPRSAYSILDCAAIHLKGKNEVAFRPFGLDVPDELGAACKQVKALLDAEKQQQAAIRNAIFAAPPWKAGTAVGKALAALTHKTGFATLEKLATFSDQEQARLTRLTEDLSKNPATAAAEQKLRADPIKRLGDALTAIAAATTEDAVGRVLALHRDAATKREAARLAAAGLFGTNSLPGCGRGGMARPVASGPPLFN